MVALKRPDCDEVEVALVLTVCRGALAKSSNEGPRVWRTSRPVSVALPAPSCKSAHCLILRFEEKDNFFWGSCLHEVCMVDPTGTIIGELEVTKTLTSRGKIRFFLSAGALHALRKLRNIKVPTVDENEAPPVAKLDSEMISGCVVKGFTAKDFTKTLAGSKRIEEFMTGLPNLYKAKGVSILDDKGFFSYKSKHGQNTILWTEVCLRMAMYFDIAITGKPKDFGRHVHWHLSTVVPGNNLDIATKQLQDLVRQMEDTTPAVLPVG